MKKVCFITTISITLRTFILDFAKRLHDSGEFEIYFICDFDKEFEKELPEYITYIPVKMRRGISLTGILATVELYKIFKRESFDMIQYSTPNAAFYASIAGVLANVNFLLYSQMGLRYTEMNGIKRFIFKKFEWLTCRNSSLVQPVSNGNFNFAVDEGLFPASKGEVIWNGSSNGVNLQKFDYKKKNFWNKEVRMEEKIPYGSKIIGFIGRLNIDKGIIELIKSAKILMRKYTDLYLIIIGEDENINIIDKELLNWFYKEERIIRIAYTDVPEKYLAAMDILIFPSYREGFGNVVIEAGAMQVTVISSDIPGPQSSIINGKTGFLIPRKSVEDIVDKTQLLFEDKELCKKMGLAAHDFVSDNFDSSILIDKIIENRKKLLKVDS